MINVFINLNIEMNAETKEWIFELCFILFLSHTFVSNNQYIRLVSFVRRSLDEANANNAI